MYDVIQTRTCIYTDESIKCIYFNYILAISDGVQDALRWVRHILTDINCADTYYFIPQFFVLN